jgi:hypothetical protein
MESVMKKVLAILSMIMVVNLPIPTRGISDSLSISSDHSGNIFILNTITQQVLRFDPKYNYESSVLDNTQISGMTNLTVCWCAGEIAVSSEIDGSSKLFEYESKTSYKLVKPLAPAGSGSGKIKNPVDMAYLRSDNDYWVSIVDNAEKKVVVVDDYGKLNKEITGLVNPKASYFSSIKKLYIIDDGQIKTANRDDKTTTGAFGKGLLDNPTDIDASGNEDKFFVLDGQQVKTFNSSGSMVNKFGQIPQACSITVNIGSNEVVVGSNADGGSLYVFSNNGEQRKVLKNVLNPVKQVILKFYVGKYFYNIGLVGVPLPCPVTIENGRSLVPVRQVVEPLGGKIEWDAKTQKITISYSNPKTIVLKIGDPYAYVDGKKTLMPSSVPPRIFCKGTTMVPLRFVSDILGATTNYYSDLKMIEVKK